MKSGNEIQIEVELYWQSFIDDADYLAKGFFHEAAAKLGLKAKEVPGAIPYLHGEIPMPRFKDTTGLIAPERYEAVLESLGDIPRVRGQQIINKVFSYRPVEYEKFFCDGGFYKHLLRGRDIIQKQRNAAFKVLPRQRASLKTNTISMLSKPMLTAPKEALQTSLDLLSYTLTYYDLLLEHIDKWFSKYGIEAGTLKDATKHPCWNSLMESAYDLILEQIPTDVSARPAKALRIMAALFSAMYPGIWSQRSPCLIIGAFRTKKYNRDNK